MKHGTKTSHAHNSCECPFNHFIFCDPIVVDGSVVVNFYGRDGQPNIGCEVLLPGQQEDLFCVENQKKECGSFCEFYGKK